MEEMGHMKRRVSITVAGGAALIASSCLLTPAASAAGSADWTMAGQGIGNTRSAPAETTISAASAAKLKVKWSVTANGDVFDTPAVSGGVTYFTDHGTSSAPSTLWAVNSGTGQVIWSHSIPSYTGIAGDTSRSTPAVTNGMLILGDQAPPGAGGGAWLLAVNASNGNLVWKTELDSHPAAVVTGSPSVYGGYAFVGISSLEEDLAGQPGYPCCTFRGSVVAVNVSSGKVTWKTYLTPSNNGQTGGYSGAAVWGSTPVVDTRNYMVYVGTGNNYTVPSGVCTAPGQTGCTAPASNDYADSVMALSIFTGVVLWSHPTLTSDVHTLACTNPGEVCGPDFDFGSGPNLYTTTMPSGIQRDLVGIGQKSGVYYALDPNSGQTVWATKIGPGTELGGIQWGSATDGTRIYAAESDYTGVPYTVNGQTLTGGSWAALDAATGRILWQTPDPQGAPDLGYMSVANGVVYAPSDAGSGSNMYALNAATGAVLWSFASGGSVIGGAAIVNGTVYWGSGYYLGTENNKLYAFGL